MEYVCFVVDIYIAILVGLTGSGLEAPGGRGSNGERDGRSVCR